MHCSTCADDVANILRQTVGIDREDVQVSFVLSRGELKFDPDKIHDVQKDIIGRVAKRFPRLDLVVLFNSEVGDGSDGMMKVRIRSSEEKAAGMQKSLDSITGVKTTLISPGELYISYDPDLIGIRHILSILREQDSFGDVELDDVPDGTVMAKEAEEKHLKGIAIQTILASIFTVPCLVLAWSGSSIKIENVIRYGVECACATAVLMVAYRIYLDAFWSLVYGGAGGVFSRVNMDVLVSCATGAAYIFSVAIFAVHIAGRQFGDGPQTPFFETSCLLTTLILGGRWVTAWIRSWASKRLQKVGDGDLQIADVRFYNEETEEETKMDANELQYGDIIIASQGEKVATDGLVVVGKAQVDESHLTGEPKPQTKSEGSYVLAGSKIVSGDVKFRVSKLTQENTISTIKGMVKLASQQKPRTQKIADRVAAVLTPIILIFSIGVFVVWLLVCALVRKNSWDKSAVIAATYAVATLAISCPCAIALAVPIVLVVASKIGLSKGGFVFKNPAAVERARKVGKVIFDKTGTLTTGQLHVEHAWVFESGQWAEKVPRSVISVLQILCKSSNHPVARAMYRFSRDQPELLNELGCGTEMKDIVSKGIEGTIDGVIYRGGKLSFTAPRSTEDPIVQERLQKTQSVFTLSANSHLIAIFSLKDDKIRPEVPAVLQKLREKNIEIFIFSGDRSEAVFPIADELEIPRSNVYSNCYPEDKRARLEALKEQHKKPKEAGQPQNIVFVGDGTNDAIALAAADIGISLSQSTDMATNSADVAIISDSIVGLIGFLELSRRIHMCIILNFAWAVGWNVFAILGASGAWVNVRIAPQWAGLGEVGSVLPVFLISALVGWGYRSGVHLL
ncbi:E1-E2 ATPase-domain-containing protein [Geopyxis carbonaria]|nr:E1-E2 ATPase-domain-containing protein [Geopyxis carbonaria]